MKLKSFKAQGNDKKSKRKRRLDNCAALHIKISFGVSRISRLLLLRKKLFENLQDQAL